MLRRVIDFDIDKSAALRRRKDFTVRGKEAERVDDPVRELCRANFPFSDRSLIHLTHTRLSPRNPRAEISRREAAIPRGDSCLTSSASTIQHWRITIGVAGSFNPPAPNRSRINPCAAGVR